MYGTPYIFYFVHPIVKTVQIMVQRVHFERNLKNISPATVIIILEQEKLEFHEEIFSFWFC